ncbi:hypothetical protein H1R20_g5082, partial [Candolleomyces eurysporus]
MAVKEDVRKLLERLIRTIEPDSRLLSFGSTANGFSLRNSEDKLSAADLVTMLGDLLERETKFHVKTLPHARIPIVKLNLDPSPGLPHGIACDIGFENRLALENTRLLMCYAMIDPTRVRTIVLFLKVWSKRRKINSPYKGTLSSYGYVLLVIYFLVHVKNPPILPNLQQMPPLRPITKEETHLNGHNIWFFDDIDLLRQRWVSENAESVAELLIDFFRYYARDFQYNTGVASIRSGLLKKEEKGWQNDYSGGRYDPSRERNRFCIEDPFELDYNVARCVTKDGLYTIRGEFMRAARVLSQRPDRAIVALAELCEERKDEELVSAPSFNSSRPPAVPPQTPYTVGGHSMRPKGVAERLSPPTQFFNPASRVEVQPKEQISTASPAPPEHMAPKRSKWTSPPPPEAAPADRTLFESKLDKGLELATAPTQAREPDAGSETNSEIFTDEERSDAAESDDILSVKSYTEGAGMSATGPTRRPSWHLPDGGRFLLPGNGGPVPTSSSPRPLPSSRGRFPRERSDPTSSPNLKNVPEFSPTGRNDFSRRPLSGPPRAFKNGSPVWASHTPVAVATPLPPSPESPMEPYQHHNEGSTTTVYYQTATATRSPRPVLYSPGGTHNTLLSHYQSSQPHSPLSSAPHSPSLQHSPRFQQQQQVAGQVPPDILPSGLPPALSSLNPRSLGGRSNNGPDTPTPRSYSHSHSNSITTVTAPTPPPTATSFAHSHLAQPGSTRSPLAISSSSSGVPERHASSASSSPRPHPQPPLLESTSSLKSHSGQPSGNGVGIGNNNNNTNNDSASPHLSAGNSSSSNGSSPSPSSTGYSTSISRSPSPRSPSPHSPSPPPTAIPIKPPHSIAKGEDAAEVEFSASFAERLVVNGGEGEEERADGYLVGCRIQHQVQVEEGRGQS